MISVQNHRQLLNGNNFLIFVLVIFGSTSCAAKKITTTNKVEVAAIKTKSNIRTFSSAAEKKRYEDSIARIAVPFDLDKSKENNSINNSNTNVSVGSVKVLNNDPNRIHNIAVLLPFNLDQIPLGMYVDDSTKQLTPESKNAMEFYLGCQMARQKFQSENLKTNVYFLDDRNDSLKVATIFTKKPFPNIDYVIGPIGYKNLKLAADLAKSNQIPLISPFASSIYIKENSYFFNANASLYNQYSFILDHTKNKFPNKILEVIYDGKDSSAENITFLKELADKYYSYSNIKYTSLRSIDDVGKTMNQSDTLSQRIILIYSSKDIYVKSVIAKLKSVKNDLQIFTSAVAKNTKALTDVKFPHDIFTVYSLNAGTINASIFSDRYEERYKRKPSDFANQGYDLMLHLFNMLDKNQNLQDYGKNYSLDFDNTQTRFQFKPVLNKAGNIDYYDNTFLYLYKYNGGGFSVVSPN